MTTALSSSFKSSATEARQGHSRSTRPFSIRLTVEERRRLEGEAGAQPLGTYVRARLLRSAARCRISASVQDRTALSQILGRLGQLKLVSSLSDLALAASTGAVAMTPDLEWEVQSACRDIRDMRAMLMRALGLKAEACA